MVEQQPKDSNKKLSLAELENLTEQELETAISTQNSDDARFILGRLLIEGTNDKFKKNVKKGLNWIKESVKNNHLPSIEYKTYYDIRFDPQPKMKKIIPTLEMIAEKTKSTRACNTLAEFYQAQATQEENKVLAAKYYNMSAEQGCSLGTHWLGVFYSQGFGVSKNVQKAIEYLNRSAKDGNCQSDYQLFNIYSQEESFKDVKKAYFHLERAAVYGVTLFDQMHEYFKNNFDDLVKMFIERKQPSSMINKDNKEEVINLHSAYVTDMRNTFSQALSKDRLYLRPCGFVMDNQIWLVGLQMKYFIKKVLRFNHQDFIKAVKTDIGPLFGEVGLWVLNNYVSRQKENGKSEKRKQGQVAIEIVKNYLENGLDYLGKENKYHFINKFSPKKQPEKAIKRDDIKFIYSWMHYAPNQWFEHMNKLEQNLKQQQEAKENTYKKCSFCGSPESAARKHKICSACKKAFYCSTDCQKYDWQKNHKVECKKLQAKK